MTGRGIFLVSVSSVWMLMGSARLGAAPAQEAPPFKEVYDLVRSNLAGINDAELNRAVVDGLLTSLSPKVAVVSAATGPERRSDSGVTGKPTVFDHEIGYLRITRVEGGLGSLVREQYRALSSTNNLKGVIIDLRYADGSDYATAAAVADLFVKKERPLLNWGKGFVRSHEKADAIAVPAAVLVNHQTARAAEALAAVLREVGAGLVLGNKTAGEAMITREFPLSNGQKLRIATAAIEIGEGGALPARGLVPDIEVVVNAEDERAYYADAFRVISKPRLLASTAGLSLSNTPASTNRPARRTRFNEAELVRERREGVTPEGDLSAERTDEPDVPIVHDPALARAMDLLKGLAVVHESRF